MQPTREHRRPSDSTRMAAPGRSHTRAHTSHANDHGGPQNMEATSVRRIHDLGARETGVVQPSSATRSNEADDLATRLCNSNVMDIERDTAFSITHASDTPPAEDTHVRTAPSGRPLADTGNDTLLNELALVRKVIPEKKSRALEHTEFVFVKPPGSGSNEGDEGDYQVNVGRLSLLDGHPANVPFLLYEEWLLSTLVRLEDYINHPSGHVRLRVKVLRDEIEDELDQVRQTRVREWKRQRVGSKRKHNRGLSLPTREAFVVVTGKRVTWRGLSIAHGRSRSIPQPYDCSWAV